ncbi:uncharacterized protein HMPREF1541_05598 [Cyphellophora europaea CBS 101466]|uniref:Velvet domain-containing protein n=1 Tax=Cyphellophora europaea (strain CBS 101466) TaxID=1220924 RepID=W2RSW1_CYPE1|nr:uncharacterized protein HMPREF1541_05598 [Cyphellophora europaea CBS 101466]ETN39375.1 hypothetical protein HMPREF1541_05598 [Cyphellophora europaea CBS 101466]
MLAAPYQTPKFPEATVPHLAPSASQPTLPPLSQFPLQPGPPYGSSSYTAPPLYQQSALHHAPLHPYHATGAYQSFPPSSGVVSRCPNQPSLRIGETESAAVANPGVSPSSRGPLAIPLKRPYDLAEERQDDSENVHRSGRHPRLPGEATSSQQPHFGDTSESRIFMSSTSVSSTSTPTTASYQTLGTGPWSAGQSVASISPRATRFSLRIRQQPRAARAGPDGKDRRPIDPPPVLQLLMSNFDPQSQADLDELQSQFVVHCRLVSANPPRRDMSTLSSYSEDGSREIQRLLLGTSVASPFHTKDDPDVETAVQHPPSVERASGPGSPSQRFFASGAANNPGSFGQTRPVYGLPCTFFIFADLSVRKAGEYKLEFSLMKMEPGYLMAGEKLPILHTVASHVFRVVNAKDFDQVQPSTPLVRGLIERGAGFPLKLKKGTREGGRRRTGRGDDDSGSDDDDE